MTAPLEGRRILVTGGATGIGAAAVHVLSEAGARGQLVAIDGGLVMLGA